MDEHPHHDGFDGFGVEALAGRPGVKWRRVAPDGAIAAWVADMDFPQCPPVAARLRELLDIGDLGYPDWLSGTPLRAAFAERMAASFGWKPDPAAVREVTDIVQGLQIALHLVTAPGDAVALHTPAYPPFLHSVTDAGRRLVGVPMTLDGADGAGGARGARWTFDLQALDDAVARAKATVFVLVNPHNPTGRVFTREELTQIADVAARHNLLVVSDEIHSDLVYAPHRHVPFASLSDDAAARTVTLTSASKAFNLAGLRCAVSHVGPADLLARRDALPPDLFGAPNLFGVEAALAAWSPASRPWSQALIEHLDANRRRVLAAAGAELPGVGILEPEGTYLAWLDVAGTGLTAAALREVGVRLTPGPDFGPGGEGFVRLNFATSAEVLEEILARLARALNVATPSAPPSTATAMSEIIWFMSRMRVVTLSSAEMASVAAFSTASTRRTIVSEERAASSARFFTSAATTLNPRPALPARAASMVALSASSRVWAAICVIRSTLVRISSVLARSEFTVCVARDASLTASRA